MTKSFIGTKLVLQTSMTRLEYNKYRGWDLPSDENANDEGYLVEYLDGGQANHPAHKGYISWSPKEVFANAYKDSTAGKMTFGNATDFAKLGKKVARIGWNGAGMFAYIVPAASYPAQTGAAKSHFGENVMVPYREYWVLKTAQGDVSTWAPSGSDSLAEDWIVVD